MDTEEMYERGVADAERGEPQPFYYQHYYHYRRGYDRTHRRVCRSSIWDRRRGSWRWLVGLAVVLIAGGGMFAVARSRFEPPAAAHAPLAFTTAPQYTPAPVRTPIFPTAPPSPLPTGLRASGSALVTNTEGKPLRGRKTPSLNSAATTVFAEGERVRILEGPVQADGYIWWLIQGAQGNGWSAQQSQDGVVWLQPAE